MMPPETLLAERPPKADVLAVLITDLAESVRIMHEDQADTVRRWRQLCDHLREDVLPSLHGNLVETRGDSLVLTFAAARDALHAAFAIRRFCTTQNKGRPPHRHFLLRTAIHIGEVFADSKEVLGDAVNLAARMQSTAAGPGEIVISAEVHDDLTPVLDADIEDLGLKDLDREETRADDLGKVYFKHVEAPMRVYRVGPPGPRPVIDPGIANKLNLLPTIAVIPFKNRRRAAAGHAGHAGTTAAGAMDDEALLGEVLADDIITALSPAIVVNVVSRLSTTAFGGREATLQEMGGHLKADYVLSGCFYVHDKHVILDLELAEVASGQIKWNSQPIRTHTEAVVSRSHGIGSDIARDIVARITKHELTRGISQALPTLENYSLLINAIVRMHRGSPQHFERARQMLTTLTERIPGIALPYAWLAKWHVLRFNRGLSPDAQRESRMALNCTQRALDNDPHCALALTIDGFVHTNLLKKFDVAEQRYIQALEANPNESLAWLLKGTMHAFQGDGERAMQHTEQALRLSPLDPLRYFYESLAATAAHTAGHYDRAIELAQRSRRANCMHPSTLRALTIAQVLSGRVSEARDTVRELLTIEPNITVSGYLRNNPSGAYPIGKVWANALQQAGVPD